MFLKDLDLPNGPADKSVIVPVYLDFAPNYHNDTFLWYGGYNLSRSYTITINGNSIDHPFSMGEKWMK
jgi:hypothetical protein